MPPVVEADLEPPWAEIVKVYTSLKCLESVLKKICETLHVWVQHERALGSVIDICQGIIEHMARIWNTSNRLTNWKRQ
jgi:hypothetical protein